VYLAMGNHDNRERFWAAFAKEKAIHRPVAGRQTVLIRTRHVNWFILDSLEATLSTPGLIGEEQLGWLGKALDENAKKPAAVFVHHNPTVSAKVILKDTAAFLEVIRPRKQVKAYIFGHSHKWETSQDQSGIHFVNLPAVAYVFQPADPAGWVKAALREDGMRLELRCVDQTHKQHGQTVDLVWRT
jgi:Icc protein